MTDTVFLKLPNNLKSEPKGLTNDELENLSKQLKKDIDEGIVKTETRSDYGLNNIGAGEIGGDCSRAIWYKFRKVIRTSFSAKPLKIFKLGHYIEDVCIEYMKNAGWNVEYKTPEGKQFKIRELYGHLVGKLDFFLHNFKIRPDVVFIGDVKSFNDVNYKKWQKNGIRISHPKYYSQITVYGSEYGLLYGLIVGYNKNTSDIDVEFVRLDLDYAFSLGIKAQKIINAKEVPPRVANSIAHFKCKFCDYKKLCHEGNVPVNINCRSCIFADAIEDGTWKCQHYGVIPTSEAILTGCPNHKPIV